MNQTIEAIRPTVETFLQESMDRNTLIQKNQNCVSLVIKKLIERARAVDNNVQEVLGYLNQEKHTKIITRLCCAGYGVYQNFVNENKFCGGIFLGKSELHNDEKLRCFIKLNDNSQKIHFFSLEGFFTHCENHNSCQDITGYVFTAIVNFIQWAETNLIKKLFEQIKYVCQLFETEEKTKLAQQNKILNLVGVSAPTQVKRYKIIIEEIKED